MELIYAALLLHSTGKPVDEAGLKKVVTAAGGKADEAGIKSLVANLKDVNIEDAIKQAPAVAAAPAVGGGAEEKQEEEKEEKSEEQEEKNAEEAASGLSSLFG